MYTSTLPSILNAFRCSPPLRASYTALSTLLAALCAATTVHPSFRSSAWRPLRSAMYTLLGLSFVLPLAHSLQLYGLAASRAALALDWMALMAALNLLGAAAYVARVPERFGPRGAWDLLGNSHQVLHVAVVGAGLAHAKGLVAAFGYVRSPDGACGGV